MSNGDNSQKHLIWDFYCMMCCSKSNFNDLAKICKTLESQRKAQFSEDLGLYTPNDC